MRVCALVVTYNRERLLAMCLEAVDAQTRPVDELILVDNASTDGTPELLRERGYRDRAGVRYLRLDRNLGSSGGFAHGFEAARESNADWLWVLDDDAAAAPDCLERLLAAPPAGQAGTACVCPRVVYADGSLNSVMRADFRRRLRPLPESRYRDGQYPAIGVTSFVGPLYRMSAVRALDPPKAEFFVWGDDVEYSLRLRREGEIRLVPESVVVHRPPSQSHTNRRSRLWNVLLPVHMYPTPLERFWQNLCGLRNYIWIKRHYEAQSAPSAVGTTLQFVLKHLLYDDRPLRRLPWIIRFARDGRRGRFQNIAPAEWVDMVRRGDV
jgi:rhamnopyranosyl-N-acetylglucosaminyl-diphospho-decaprenol beta-1,3/1,4-galactofuranosyltransferase